MRRWFLVAAACLSVGAGGRPDQLHGQLLVQIGDPLRLAAVDVATGHVRRIAPGHSAYDATWSPDGRRIAFTDGDVFVVDADGRHLRRLTHDGLAEHDAAWSPDGSRIAYLRQLPPSTEPYPAIGPEDDVIVLDLRTGAVTQLTRDPQGKGELTWTPDGRRLVYALHLNVLSSRAVLLNVATGDARILDRYPLFSPDGRRVAFVDTERITLADADGARPRLLLQVGHDRQLGGLVWSPDARSLAVDYRSDQANWQLTEIVCVATGRMHPLRPIRRRVHRQGWLSGGAGTPLGRGRQQLEGGASWSPDGRLIAFVRSDFRGRPFTAELAVVRADGTKLRIVAKNRRGFGAPQWRPHH